MKKKVYYTIDIEDMRKKYVDYIDNHVSNVKFCYYKYLNCFKEIFPNVYEDDLLHEKLIHNLENHDKSKYGKEEFESYALKFYPIIGTDPESKEVKNNFKMAWLHHLHNNPHHPGYWVIVEDGNVDILDMPDIYIIEMLCDWMAMSKYYNSSTLDYWNNKGSKDLPMSYNTKSKVNKFIKLMVNCDKNDINIKW